MPAAYRASAQVFGTTTSTVITIPASVQAGDILVLQAAGGWAPNVPAGWTADFYDNTSSNVRCFVAYKTAGAGDAGTDITVTWQGAYNHVVNIAAVSGAVGIRSTSHKRSSSGNSDTTGPSSVAVDDAVIFFGGIRQAGTTISINRGTVDFSARDGANNFSGIIAHEDITVGGSVSASFTSTFGGGYLYSHVVFDGGNIIPPVAIVAADYVEVLAAGVAAARVSSDYVEVLNGGLPKAQIEMSYLEVLTNSPTIQAEAVYAEILSGGAPLLQTESVYAEVLASVAVRYKGWGIIN